MDHDPIRPGVTGAPPLAWEPSPDRQAPADSDLPALRRRSILGSLLLFLGIGLLALLLVSPGELPVSMPRSWYIDRTLWVAGGLICLGAGWYLLGTAEPQTDRDRDASIGGAARGGSKFAAEGLGIAAVRFGKVVLYTRAGCHLCDDARGVLDRYAAYLGSITLVDIDSDPALIAKFSTCVPVVEFDGKVRFRGRVNELLLRRLIAATPPR